MSAPLDANDEIDLQQWLAERGKAIGQPVEPIGQPTVVQPGCPVPGHIDHLFLGISPEEERTTLSSSSRWEPKKLNSRHREIMRRILEGANETQIAEMMGLSRTAVCLIVTSRLFQEELAKMEGLRDEGVINRAESLSGEALDTLKVQMRFARSEAIRNRAANDILDRAGYSKVEKKLIGVVNAEEVIRELNRSRREAFNAKVVGEGKGD